MSAVIISTSNPRIVAARKLRQKKHRLQQNRFLVEGLQLIARALEQRENPAWANRIVPADVFYCPSAFASPLAAELVERFINSDGQAVEVGASVLESLSAREMNQGLVATFVRSTLFWSPDDLANRVDPDRPQLLLLLDGVQYPGNLGTLLRTADAVGCLAVVQLGAGADVTDPGALRGSMGSIFGVPSIPLDSLEPLHSEAFTGFSLVGADIAAGESLWQGETLAGSTVLCLGNEAHGLSPTIAELLDHRVALPMMAGVDSLNVAVAGGILLYEWMRRNSPGS